MYTNTISAWLPWHRESYSKKAIGWLALSVAILAGSTSVTFASALAGTLSPISMLFISEALTMLFTVLSFGFFPILKRITRLKKRKCYRSCLWVSAIASSRRSLPSRDCE